MPSFLTIRDIQLIELYKAEIEAIHELSRRYIQGAMTPNLIYDLVLTATGDENKALKAQMQLELAQMPEPKNVSNNSN